MTHGANFIDKLPVELVETVNRYWQRFEAAVANYGGDEQSNLIVSACSDRPELRAVWAASDFVANTSISHPELLYDLVKSGDLDRPCRFDAMHSHVTLKIQNCENESQLDLTLRRIRRREMVRMAWRDLSGQANLEEIMAGVSGLAEACIAQALQHHGQWLSERYGEPHDSDGKRAEMVVLALGKLGGRELNYSSDVDLMFAYSESGKTTGLGSDLSVLDNQEYFIKLGRKVITTLDQVTPEGFVFRTDMRLRPNGDSGPLVLSFAAMEHYYQTHGRTWERYALIKARVISGDSGSGEALLSMLKPFIYRKYLDFGAFEAIREMKTMIERELNQKALKQDIKLGWGGIREVEFLVQSHQLIRGGREKSLQTQSLHEALDALLALGVVDVAARKILRQGYEHLRNTEHRLQMVADRQTQQLPTSELAQIRLAWSMGHDNWQSFITQLDQHRSNIHSQFDTILDEGAARTRDLDPDRSRLVDVWEGKLEQSQAVTILQAVGFRSADSVPPLLRGVREGRMYQAFSGVERDRVDRLIPLALRQAACYDEAERAMAAFICIVEAIGRRSVYLSLLIENPIALKQLLHLCAASPWISNHIGRHPVILDELLHPIFDIRDRVNADLEDELDHRLIQIDNGDEEAQMNVLREFHHAQVLRVAAADVSGVLRVADVHRALTQLAEVLLQNIFDEAIRHVEQKHSSVSCEAGIIAYGKFASGELGYHSDLDIVVCYEKGENAEPQSNTIAEYFYSRVGRRMIHLLTTRTQAGQLYELDMRLRPSGRSGTLVTSLTGFFDYQMKSAWTWEHQALVRARVVVGSDLFVEKFELARKMVLSLKRDPVKLASEIGEMRRKMIDINCQSTDQAYDLKLDEGGIVDIEFLVQYWILCFANTQAELMIPRTTSNSLTTLIDSGVISEKTGTRLLQCYEIYLRQSLDLKLMDRPVLAKQDQLLDERETVRAIWTRTFG